jgi:hypothetical protein
LSLATCVRLQLYFLPTTSFGQQSEHYLDRATAGNFGTPWKLPLHFYHSSTALLTEGILAAPGALLLSRGALAGETHAVPLPRPARQPYARNTHVPALDESYVYCFQRSDLLKEIREGFKREGLEETEWI